MRTIDGGEDVRMSSPPSSSSDAGLRALLRLPGLRRLLAVRWTSQAGDGIFQAGLAWLVLLSPERQQTPEAIAGAAALILLPFSLVGPFAGVLLDRWSRRSVLVLGQLLRVVLLVALAGLGDRAGLAPVYVLAIGALAVNRFLLATFSAGLPSVVPRRLLLPANALAPTAGTAWVVVGFALGGVLLRLTRGEGAGSAGSGQVLLVAAAVMGAAGLLALLFGRAELGPEAVREASVVGDVGSVLRGLLAGLAHLVERRPAGGALAMLGLHRFWLGLWTVQTTLLILDRDAGGGLSATAVVAGCGAAGYVSAAVVTPLARRRLSDRTWVCAMLLGSAVVALAAAPIPGIPALAVSGALLGLAAQSVKICVDTAVQRGVDESYLGRAFVTYDVVFNVSFVLAAVAAIALVQEGERGWAVPALVAIGLTVTALAYGRGGVPAQPRKA
jgi:MFS family permease